MGVYLAVGQLAGLQVYSLTKQGRTCSILKGIFGNC